MFVVHGQNGKFSAIVGTSSARKAIMHLQRMTQSGLDVLITDETGRSCDPRNLLAARPDRTKSFA